MRANTFQFIFILLCIALFAPNVARAQSLTSVNYYVVIAKASTLDEAIKRTDEINLKGFNAQYAIHPGKEYYVFLLQTDDQKKANEFGKKIRKETEFKKAWIYKGKLGEE